MPTNDLARRRGARAGHTVWLQTVVDERRVRTKRVGRGAYVRWSHVHVTDVPSSATSIASHPAVLQASSGTLKY